MNRFSPKVLISAFAAEPGRGSEQEVGWKWSIELARAGARVVVMTQTRNRRGIETALSREEFRGLPLEFVYIQFPKIFYYLKSRFACLTMPYYAAWQWMALYRARRLHTQHQFDLIHHLTFASFRVPITMKFLGLPVVIGPVGGAEQAPWSLLAHRARLKPYLKEAVRNISTRIGILTLRVFPPLRGSRGICLATTPQMHCIFQNLGYPSTVIPTIGVEPTSSEIELRDPSIPARKFLYAGRLHFLKGLQLLLDAFAMVDIEGVELTLVGRGDEQTWLERQAKELGIRDRVHFLGEVRREELSAIYRSHDVICGPSLYESGGLSVVEGMAHGLPAIVLDVGGHAVSVTPECGIKIPVGGTSQTVVALLADAISEYAANGCLLQRHSVAARQRVEDVYDWRVKINRMLEIYESIMKS